MDSYSELKYMETSCQLLQLQDITTLQKERDCIDQKIKEKQFEEKQLQRANLHFLKIVSKTKSSHNYSPEKQGIKPNTPIKPSVNTQTEADRKLQVMSTDKNILKNRSSATQMWDESSQLKPRNTQVIMIPLYPMQKNLMMTVMFLTWTLLKLMIVQ